MERLKSERTVVRRMFSKLANACEEEAKKERVDLPVLQRNAELLEAQASRLEDLDERILAAMLDAGLGEDEMCAEFERSYEYKGKAIDVRAMVQQLRRTDDGESVRSQILVARGKSKFRLPKLDPDKYDGDLKGWIHFWGQFRAIHEDIEIDDATKFQYLLRYTVPGSKARKIVESFPPSAGNYAKALDHLKARCARDESLVEVYVRELLTLVVKQATSASNLPLSSLYDSIETQLRALETLGVTQEKYAAMLYPLVESCLPLEVLKAWGRRHGAVGRSGDQASRAEGSDLDKLMEFLRAEVENEERIQLAHTGFAQGKPGSKSEPKKSEPIPSAASIVAVSDKSTGRPSSPRPPQGCIFCEKSTHESQGCRKAQNWTLSERKEAIMKKRGCFCCLKRFHMALRCRAEVKCILCGRRHYPILCPGARARETEEKKTENPVSKSLTNHTRNKVLLQTLLVRIGGETRERVARALLDSGSQRSYIVKSLAIELGLQPKGEETLKHGLFGGSESAKVKHELFDVEVRNLQGNVSINLPLLDQEKICSLVPRILAVSRVVECLRERNIELSDVGPNVPQIELLLGADVIGRLLTGKLEKLENGLVLQETVLGWTTMGECPDECTSCTGISLSNCAISDLWDLEVLGVRDPIDSEDAQSVLENFVETTHLNGEGRYEVHLPWHPRHAPLGSNLVRAKQRLMSTTKRLCRLNRMADYSQIFKEWEEEGVIEKVGKDLREGTGLHYLPHHPVIKETSATTKVRPVFDASARDENGVSLNACLHKGPNLVAKIPVLVFRFRLRRYGAVSDIRRAFLQISLRESDRNFLRFLWWEEEEEGEMVVYRHCRVVFGVAPSPFLLAGTIAIHLDRWAETGPIPRRLRDSFYVDNSVESFDSKEELEEFKRESKRIMAAGKFDLRCWVSNASEFTDEEAAEKVTHVLGLIWDYEQDVVRCSIGAIDELQAQGLTKRKLLSVVQRVYDPIGFTAPVTLAPKLLLQEAWKLKLPWDVQLPESMATQFSKWVRELSWVSQCALPRWASLGKGCNQTLHVFCDASKHAYTAAVFLRSELDKEVKVQLMIAKTRLAPIEGTSIPRLELLATLIGARMASGVMSVLGGIETHCWTDSAVALAWICNLRSWDTFVRNRVVEIRSLTNVADWKHIPGEYNPADLPSRGCDGQTLFSTRWWEGPGWLKGEKASWPNSMVQPDEKIVAAELCLTGVTGKIEKEHVEVRSAQYFSKYSKVIRARAWVARFLGSFKGRNGAPGQSEEPSGFLLVYKEEGDRVRIDSSLRVQRDLLYKKIGTIKELSREEVAAAEMSWMKIVQETFQRDPARLKKLNTFVDEAGVRRVKTKLWSEGDTDQFNAPILLPFDHPLVRLLIEETHRLMSHAGVQTVVLHLRERFWVTRSRKTVKGVINSCVVCKKQTGKPAKTIPAPLPRDRIHLGKAFDVCGVDLAGPLFVKGGGKSWIVLFTCAVYRAVHLELVVSCSTQDFVMALRRFVARRGRVSTIYSDNGTNFTGASNELKRINWAEIQTYSAARRITWKFNPPTATWWGGWWERLVRTVKEIMRRNLGKRVLKYDELQPVLCDVEAVVNSRPLTYVSEDPEDLQPLTPAMFLTDVGSSEVPDLDEVDRQNLTQRIRVLQRVRDACRSRFRREYQAFLKQAKAEKSTQLQVGDLVLVQDDRLKRVFWSLARVLEVIPGRDGEPRVARVLTTDGTLTRPVARLYPLEVEKKDAGEITDRGQRSHPEGPTETRRTCPGREATLGPEDVENTTV